MRHALPLAPILLPALALLLGCAGAHEAQTKDAAPAVAPTDGAPAEAPAPFTVAITGAGPDLVLIPGLSNPGEALAPVAAHFAQTHTVHTLSLAGFGATPPLPGDSLLPVVAEALGAYVEGLDRPVLMGHSLGGSLALWVAAEHPAAVSRVVAIDGVPYLPALMNPDITPEAASAGAAAMKAQIAPQGPEAFCAQTRQALQSMITSPADVETVAALACKSAPQATAQAVFDLYSRDMRPEMARVTAPILLLAAGAFATTDEIRTMIQGRYEDQLAQAPQARVVLIEGARHYVFLDQPEAFYGEVDAFLGEDLQ